jgi:hypothetical protein
MTENDYSAFVEEAQDNDALAKLAALAQELYEAQLEVAKAESALKAAQARRNKLSEVTIPEAMDDAGLKNLETPSGIKLEVTSKIRGAMKGDAKDAAMDWLEKNGQGGIIKNQVIVEFGKGEDEDAIQLEEELIEEEWGDVDRKRSVHAQTLEKWIRERMEQGQPVPEELFNVYEQRTTKVKKNKDD